MQVANIDKIIGTPVSQVLAITPIHSYNINIRISGTVAQVHTFRKRILNRGKYERSKLPNVCPVIILYVLDSKIEISKSHTRITIPSVSGKNDISKLAVIPLLNNFKSEFTKTFQGGLHLKKY